MVLEPLYCPSSWAMCRRSFPGLAMGWSTMLDVGVCLVVSVDADRDWKVILMDEMEKQSCMDVPEPNVHSLLPVSHTYPFHSVGTNQTRSKSDRVKESERALRERESKGSDLRLLGSIVYWWVHHLCTLEVSRRSSACCFSPWAGLLLQPD